ncbi:MAG: DUF3800 domain-containing protein [Muribaculaceae bacterium]
MEKQKSFKYYLFIDECGDHNLDKYDPTFPIFTLCGILVSSENLKKLTNDFMKLKQEVFGNTDVIIHSVDIRKWRNDFIVLKDDELRARFFCGIEEILSYNNAYVIVSCTILKEQLNKFCVRGEEDDVYGLSLSYLIERSIFFVDNQSFDSPTISIIVERRGKKEDAKLLNYYNGLRNRGTKWIKPERLRNHICGFEFKYKRDNVIGLQIADLIAYPITQHFLHPERPNRSYDAIKHNFFSDNGVLLGQKVIPH